MKTFLLASLALLGFVSARCPNGCSNQGLCGPNSQCKCYRNFQGSDCSERVCYYALSFVDTPAGDLNADGAIGMGVTYEEGTQDYAIEGYPINYGAARPVDGTSESGRWDEGHFYRECSNKGICNRKTGQCACFPGYEGEGCQRTTCPGTSAGVTCSGHGLCLNAYHDLGSDYALWDKEKTMKCECDKGYSGPDCSIRQCPVGPDPVKHSDKVTTSLQKITFGAFTYEKEYLTGNADAFDKILSGPVYFTVTVTDDFGDEWTTNTMSIEYATSCETKNMQACRSKPVFNKKAVAANAKPDVSEEVAYAAANYQADRHYGYAVTSDPSSFDWYSTNTIADDLNISLQGLPNGAVKEPYVWMWYTDNSQNAVGDTAKNTAAVHDSVKGEVTRQASAGTSEEEEKTIFEAAQAAEAKTGSAAVAAHIAKSITYRSQDIKYPSTDYEGKALYWQSPRTRFPDFNSNSNPDKKWHDCGRIDGKEDINNDAIEQEGPGKASIAATKDLVHSTEGLCLYISSGNKITTAKNYRVTYMYNADVYYTNGPGASVKSFKGQTQVGESIPVITTDAAGAGTQAFADEDTAIIHADSLINGEEAIVTVEEVGLYRYWDVNVDGYPERSYQSCTASGHCTSTFEVHECSKRGICDESTGECRCFSGYTGTSCNAQNAISYSS